LQDAGRAVVTFPEIVAATEVLIHSSLSDHERENLLAEVLTHPSFRKLCGRVTFSLL
jgi:hypothetical protein